LSVKDYLAGVLVSQEIVLVTSRTGDVFTITRAYEPCPENGTTTSQVSVARSFSAYVDSNNGTVIELNTTAGTIQEISAELVDLDNEKLSISDYISGGKLYDDSTTGTDAYEITLANVTSYSQIN